MTEVRGPSIRARTVDLSDHRNPEHSGRYVLVSDLLVALREARRAADPFAAIEDLITRIASQR